VPVEQTVKSGYGVVARRSRQSIVLLLLPPVLLLLSMTSRSKAQTVRATGIPVVVETTDSKDRSRHSGQLQSINSRTVTIKTESGATASVDLERILSLRVIDLPNDRCPAVDASGWLNLTTGDLLRVHPLFIDEATITARWEKYPELPKIELPLELCSGFAFSVSAEPARQGRDFATISNRSTESDLVTLRNGDQIDGEFVELLNETVTITGQAGDANIGVSLVRSLAFNPTLISRPRVPAAFSTLLLRDGSVLWLSEFKSDGDVVICTLLAGTEISIPVSIVSEIRMYDARRQSLSTPPGSGTETPSHQLTTIPFLSTSRPDILNRNVLGSPVLIRGQRFGTCLGSISGSSRSISLGRRFAEFRTSVGIDDVARGRGSVVFEVLTDGQSAWKSDIVTGSTPLVTVPPVSVSGVENLTLRIHYSSHGDVCDYANWLNPVLIATAADQR
jgi:hypothetical protein